MKAPMTDKTLGIKPDHADKFRNVRVKARDEYLERAKKRKKDTATPVPKYGVGDQLVISDGGNHKVYHLIEVVDFEIRHRSEFSYYGILLKTTDAKTTDRVGRLMKTDEWGYYRFPHIENIPPESIKWEMEKQ